MDTDLTLDEWVAQLAELCPDVWSLEVESVRSQLREQGFVLEDWDVPRPRREFKSVLHAIAQSQPHWLYATDWKGPREEAARQFEQLLTLPAQTLAPLSSEPIVLVAEAANEEARQRGTSEQLEYLPPYDDSCVFALVDPSAVELRVFLGLAEPEKPDEAPLELADDDVLEAVSAFSVEALNVFQNMGVRTVGELCHRSVRDLRSYARDGSVIEHTREVLRRAGRSLS